MIASECGALSAAAQALGEAIKQNSTVTNIDLGTNHIGEEGGKARFGCRQRLVLIASAGGAPGSAVQALGEALKQNGSVTEITLYNNQTGDEGAKARFGCQWSVALLASECCFHGAAVQALAEALEQTSTIAVIDLRRNQISDKGAKARRGCIYTVLRSSLSVVHLLHKSRHWEGPSSRTALSRPSTFKTTKLVTRVRRLAVGVSRVACRWPWVSCSWCCIPGTGTGAQAEQHRHENGPEAEQHREWGC